MSGLLLVWNSDPALATSSGFDRSFDALSHRGPDGSRICREGTVALGHQHFRTTLEEKSRFSNCIATVTQSRSFTRQ